MTYSGNFYARHQAGAARSASQIVPMVLEWTKARSVIDIGCGVGAWLSVFKQQGVDDIFGVDGPWVDLSMLRIPRQTFAAFDLQQPYKPLRTYDLAMSVEVAEHLPAACAATFVRTLTGLSQVVLFSAAVPHQGGEHHVNEQWPDYWTELFAAEGYRVIDPLRRRIWKNEAVDWFYAQNLLMFATADYLAVHGDLKTEQERTDPGQLAIVHPSMYLKMQELNQRLQLCSADIGRLVPAGEPFILADLDQYRQWITAGARALPFIERDGAYWGPPADDAMAMAEFDRLRREFRPRFMIFLWPAFWWLDYYRTFGWRLRNEFHCVMDNDRLMAFDLRS